MRGGLQPGSPNSESFEVDIAAPNAVPRVVGVVTSSVVGALLGQFDVGVPLRLKLWNVLGTSCGKSPKKPTS